MTNLCNEILRIHYMIMPPLPWKIPLEYLIQLDIQDDLSRWQAGDMYVQENNL